MNKAQDTGNVKGEKLCKQDHVFLKDLKGRGKMLELLRYKIWVSILYVFVAFDQEGGNDEKQPRCAKVYRLAYACICVDAYGNDMGYGNRIFFRHCYKLYADFYGRLI